MGCKFEPIFDKLEKAGRTEEADIVRQYAEAKKTEKMQGLLDPEQQDLIQQVTELHALSDVATALMKKAIPVDPLKISVINGMRPTWKGRSVTVLRVVQDMVGNSTALIKVGNKHYNVDVALLQSEKGSIKDKLEYGAEPGNKLKDGFVKKLDSSRVASVEEMLKLFDELAEKDSISIDAAHKKFLRNTLKYIVGALNRALPEMSIHVNDTAVRNNGHFVLKPQGESELELELNTRGSNSALEKSIAEIFVHEMVHAATSYALERLKENAPFEIIQLRKIREAALKSLDYKVFMPEVSVDKEVEEKTAKALFDYINKSLPEFVAYALTNKKIRDRLKDVMIYESKKPDKLIDKLMYYVKKIVDMALMKWRKEDITTTGDKAIDRLFIRVAQIQAEAMVEAEREGLSLDVVFDKMDEFVAGKMEKLGEKLERKVVLTPKPVGNIWKKARWFAEGLYQLLTNSKANGALEVTLSALKMKPEGTIQNIISHIKAGDSLRDIATNLALQSLQIDGHRETLALTTSNVANKLFKKPLKAVQRKALHVGLMINDAAQLVVDDRIDEMLDDEVAKATYKELEEQLEASGTAEEIRFYKYQIEGLAKLMLTGKGSSVQLKNAIAIARRLGTNISQDKASVKLIKLIDDMVSLRAWEMSNKSIKKEIRDLIVADRAAVKAIAKLHKGMQQYVKNGYTPAQRLNMSKNYQRETYDSTFSALIAPIADQVEMRRKGYKLVKTVNTVGNGRTGKIPVGLYVSKDMVKQPFNKSALRIAGLDQDGIPLMQMEYFARNSDAYKTARDDVKFLKKMDSISNDLIMQGKTAAPDENVVPVLDDNGKIVDYMYTTSTSDKLLYLGLELDGPEAIGRGFAHEVDREESQKHNQVLWEEMMIDVAKNKGFSNFNKNLKEYVEINMLSKIGMVADIAKILPKEYKDALYKLRSNTNSLTGLVDEDVAKEVVGERVWKELNDAQKTNLRAQLADGKLWVRRDMLLPMFGARDLSLMNTKFAKLVPQAIQTYIRHLEGMWKALVALYKVDVVIRTLPVMIFNFLSNFMSGVIAGENPIEIVKNYTAAWAELNHYIATKQRLAQLTAEQALGKDSEEIRIEVDRLMSDLESSPLKPLVDAGLYTQIVEETEAANYTSSNRIARWAQARQEAMPEMVQKGTDVLWVTNKTAVFQMLHAAQAKSDFVARYSQFTYAKKKEVKKQEKALGRKLTEKEIKNIEHQVLKFSITAFVEYTSPESPFLQYLNDMGLVMFTKYAIRVQASIRQLFDKYPARAAAAIFGQELMFGAIGWDPEDIMEKSVFTHGTDIFYSPHVYDMLKNLVEPQMFTYAADIIKVATK